MSLGVDDAQFNGVEALAWRILQDQGKKNRLNNSVTNTLIKIPLVTAYGQVLYLSLQGSVIL